MNALAEDGQYMYSGDYTYQVGIFPGTWHKMQIRIDQFHYVSFMLDNTAIWKPTSPVNPTLLQNKQVVLGYTSPGQSGKAYHDFVKVLYPLPY